MNALTTPQSFLFEAAEVRAVMRGDEPWFVGKDVCAALGHKNHKDALTRLEDDEREGVAIADPLGRNPQTMTVISEAGCYRLVFTSRTAAAERFKRWLAHEVLPALRRTGRFEMRPAIEDDEALPSTADARLWGLTLPALIAASRMAATIRSIYGPEHARRLWESEPSLPQVRNLGLNGSIEQWLAAECERQAGAISQSATLYAAYCGWCEAGRRRPETIRRFGDMLTASFDKKEIGGRNHYFGIGLRAQAKETAPPD
jgi:prophage antirepressor-like protein